MNAQADSPTPVPIVGEFNRMAVAAAQTIVEHPGQVYNPLLIVGSFGTGKTMLLQYIYAHMSRVLPDVKYLNAEQYSNAFIESIHTGTLREFRNSIRSADALIIDDIQLLYAREGTCEQLRLDVSALLERGKQVVVASQIDLQSIRGVSQRLASILSGGLHAVIHSPDRSSLANFVTELVEESKVQIDETALKVLLSSLPQTVREAKELINRLAALSALRETPIDVDLVREVSRSSVDSGARHDLKEDRSLLLQALVSDYSPEPEVIDGLVRLFRALNALHIAYGGRGLAVDDWQLFVEEHVPAEVL